MPGCKFCGYEWDVDDYLGCCRRCLKSISIAGMADDEYIRHCRRVARHCRKKRKVVEDPRQLALTTVVVDT